MTASSRVDRVRVDSLDLGPSTIADLHLPVLKEADVGGDGMVGIDALVQQRLMMDFEKRTIKVEDARKPQPRMDGDIVVVARVRRGQLILTQVSLNGRPVQAVIDTGSEITIGNMALREQLARRYGNKFGVVDVTGVTGVTARLELLRVGELRIGSIRLQDVPIAFAPVPPFAVFDLEDKPALLLGTDLLEPFRRVSLDFRARKVRFQLRKCGTSGILVSTGTTASLSRLSSDTGGAACVR